MQANKADSRRQITNRDTAKTKILSSENPKTIDALPVVKLPKDLTVYTSYNWGDKWFGENEAPVMTARKFLRKVSGKQEYMKLPINKICDVLRGYFTYPINNVDLLDEDRVAFDYMIPIEFKRTVLPLGFVPSLMKFDYELSNYLCWKLNLMFRQGWDFIYGYYIDMIDDLKFEEEDYVTDLYTTIKYGIINTVRDKIFYSKPVKYKRKYNKSSFNAYALENKVLRFCKTIEKVAEYEYDSFIPKGWEEECSPMSFFGFGWDAGASIRIDEWYWEQFLREQEGPFDYDEVRTVYNVIGDYYEVCLNERIHEIDDLSKLNNPNQIDYKLINKLMKQGVGLCKNIFLNQHCQF